MSLLVAIPLIGTKSAVGTFPKLAVLVWNQLTVT